MVSPSGAKYFEPIYKERHPIQNCVQDYFYLEGISSGRRFKEIRRDDKLAYELQANDPSSLTRGAYLRTALKIVSWFTGIIPAVMLLLHSFITPINKASVAIVNCASMAPSPKKSDVPPSPKPPAASPVPEVHDTTTTPELQNTITTPGLQNAITTPELPNALPSPDLDGTLPSPDTTIDDESSVDKEVLSPSGKTVLDPQVFASPASITFVPSPKHVKQFQPHYQGIKAKLANKTGISVAFDDRTKSITFHHAEREVKAIFTSESLSHYLPQFFTLTRGSLFSVGADKFELQRSTDFKGKRALLLKKAQSFFNTQKGKFVAVDSTLKPGQLLGSLLKSNQGICIGHVENDKSPQRYLINNMTQLHKIGVKTLFLELLCYDTAQKWLDVYFSAPLDKPMHPYLAQYLRELDASGRKDSSLSYANLVIAAKKAGIRIVALDTTVSSLAGHTDRTGTNDVRDRLMAMNYTAVEIIRREAGIDKYVALMSSQHVGDNDKVPGVANVLQIPSVVITDAIGNASASLKANVANFRGRVKKIGAHMQYPKAAPAKIVQQKPMQAKNVVPKTFNKAGKVAYQKLRVAAK